MRPRPAYKAVYGRDQTLAGYIVKRFPALVLCTTVLAACSASDAERFPALPTSAAEQVTLNGRLADWVYTGPDGCYGLITDGSTVVQLWMDALACGDREVPLGEPVSVDITYVKGKAYGPWKTYTIKAFN